MCVLFEMYVFVMMIRCVSVLVVVYEVLGGFRDS